jgi:hypothetical protein
MDETHIPKQAVTQYTAEEIGRKVNEAGTDMPN